MSEYWVSHKKYFCKYCNIYIADDVPSRRQHDGGLRHKGNVERFVRGLYKSGEKRKQDLEEEKREMARVEKSAQAAFAQDVGAGLVKPGSSSTTLVAPVAGPSRPAVKSSDPYANYTTAASLGYTDPDAERRKVEAERRMQEGVIGGWEVVAVVDPVANGSEGEAGEGRTEQGGGGDERFSREQERKHQPEVPIDDDDLRPFKLRRKTMAAGLGELYDPGNITIKVKPKREENSSYAPQSQVITSVTTQAASTLPKWSAKGWNKPGTLPTSGAEKTSDSQPQTEAESHVSFEEGAQVVRALKEELVVSEITTEPKEVKIEEGLGQMKTEETETNPAPATGSLFRKRKAPLGAGASRGRR